MKLKHRTQIGIIIFSAAAILVGLISFIVLEAPRDIQSNPGLSASSAMLPSSVPANLEADISDSVASVSKPQEQAGKRINLNTASIEELMTLDGIGETLAGRIVAYREENGGFSAIEELKNVSGIGEKRFEKIKDNITVS